MKDFDTLFSRIEALLHRFDVPGLSLAIVYKGEVIYAGGFGTRTMCANEPVDEQTVFAIASMSKSMTAACLGMLVEDGRLNWDDPVAEYLPGFRMVDPVASNGIRVRDLLIHNSGLRDVSGGTIWYGSDYDRDEVVRRIRYLKPVSDFRSQFAYQNVLYLAAGQVAAAVSGMSWDALVRSRLFTPLGMACSSTLLGELDAMDNVATPHAPVRGQLQPVPYRNHDNVGPAASVNSCALDLARYVRMFLEGGAGVLQPETVAELFHPQTIVPFEVLPRGAGRLNASFRAYGLGWYLQDYAGQKLVYHSGGVDGMRGRISMLPEHQFGVVVLSNAEVREAYLIATLAMLDAFLGLPAYDWEGVLRAALDEHSMQDREQAARRNAARRKGTHPSLSMEDYAGLYADRGHGEIYLEIQDGRLVLRFGHTPAFTADLEHWHLDTFMLHWRDPYVPDGLATFELDSHGRVRRIVLDQPNLLDVDFNEMEIVRVG